MNKFKNDIDKLVSKILSEEIENKAKQLFEEMGEWTEIEVDEELKGGQKKIDVAEPKGKITAADFKKLRDNKTNKKKERLGYLNKCSFFTILFRGQFSMLYALSAPLISAIDAIIE